MLGLALPIAIVLALILVNGLLSLAEMALVSSKRYRLQQMAEDGKKGAHLALSLQEDTTRFLSAVQVGITLVVLLSGAFGESSIASEVAGWLIDTGLSEGWAGFISTASVIVVLAYLSIVIGEIVPKRIGLALPEQIASRVALPMYLFSRVAAPAVWLLTLSSGAVLRLLGLHRNSRDSISEEEIRLLIGQSAESGSVNEEEAELLDRVFHFGDRRVHEIMVPRTDMVALPLGLGLQSFFDVFRNNPHSRFPVIDRTPDQIVGILGIKQMVQALGDGRLNQERGADNVTFLMEEAYFVPETKLIGDLFREMQAKGIQMAVAIDEFGGTAGIVTLEQMVEEMLGPVGDELRPPEAEIQELAGGVSLVDGSLSVTEARDELAIDIPEGDYDTIAGFVMAELGHVPEVGETLTVGKHQITVVSKDGQRLEHLEVSRLEHAGKEAG